MPSLNTLSVFALAVLAFAAVPGPAVFYVVTRSVSQGRRAGVVSAAGIAAGTLVHVVAATVGLSALLSSSATAFSIVKYLGAAYLVYLGVRALRRDGNGDESPAAPAQTLRRLFRDGVVVAVLNPKTALFFLAFLPQFVEAGRGPAQVQLAVLGLVLVAIALASDAGYAMATGSAGNWLRNRGQLLRRSRFVTGGAYITLGVTAALTGERASSGEH